MVVVRDEFVQCLRHVGAVNHTTRLSTNYRHLLQALSNFSSPFITTGPRTDSVSLGDIKLLNRFGPFFVDCSNCGVSYS